MPEPVEFLTVRNRKLPNYKLRFILLILAAVACIMISFVIGRFSITIGDVLQILLSAFYDGLSSALSHFLLSMIL